MTRTRPLLAVLLVLAFALPTTVAFAADDPSIEGALRAGIQASMKAHIEAGTVDGVYHHYDPVDGHLLHLTKANLHDGIVKKGDFYVSCADFVDQNGRSIDIDFLVVDAGSEMRTLQALVHKVEGDKRPYDVEGE